MARTFARVAALLVVVAAGGCNGAAVQPDPDVHVPYEDDRMAYVGTAGGGLPVRGSAALRGDECVEIAPTACLPPVRAGRWCADEGGPVDLVLTSGFVEEMVCYPGGDDGAMFVAGDDGDAPTMQDVDGRAVVLTGDVVIDDDVVVEGDFVSLYGAGPARTRIEGDLILRGRGARVRGVHVVGDVVVEGAQAAILFSRVDGSIAIGAGETDGSVLAGNDVLGQVVVRAVEATLVANRVQGPFLVYGEDARCADNLAFDDLDGDGAMAEQGEVLGRLGCEPNGLRYVDR